ncbi:putative necrosis-inducing factor-domain-containing protein [Clohesyomyces aquaticus]|uniref:Putative necrosis-inducing factor-domain-containing protein n=1 Tax=Clohesyomyces aquaticus TaxID=1231657 RepID=A0A1Y1ZRJ4_9PLEO|nr:putative necrosis-inducing factor-domain-containing protein [Clohesyomyces aquaticus]
MLFSTAQLALALSSLQYVYSMPTTPRAESSRLTPRTNDCGASDFVNASSTGSPLISDCLQIAANIVHGGAFFITAVNFEHTIASFGSCAFQVQTSDFGIVHVGNEDIIDLINESIARFAAPNPGQNFVGASGQMGCQTVGHTAPVAWAIIRT